MTSLKMGTLPALRRQHLLAEFAGLKQACPDGVFVSLTPGDPTLWSGVIFVRKGPYETAILRFQISFPDTYPRLPPLVTFSTDMFHPLITPLTTYMYTTDIHDNGTVSATDEERLPPGGFSLRHGFPGWFGRGSSSSSKGRVTSGSQSAAAGSAMRTPPRCGGGARAAAAAAGRSSVASTPATASSSSPAGFMLTRPRRLEGGGGGVVEEAASTYDVLRYIASAFDDEAVLDSVPLEAAGNPGAWHAWRTRQARLARVKAGSGGDGGGAGPAVATPPALPSPPPSAAPADAAAGLGTRRPGEWNWDGVWEERVKRGIVASLSEPVLFGSAGAADDVIRFLNMDRGDVDSVKANLLKTLGPSL